MAAGSEKTLSPADLKKLSLVAKRWAGLAKAVVEFDKACAAAANPTDPADAVRMSRIRASMPRMDELHGTLVAIARNKGADVEVLGGGPTPKE